MKRYIRKHAFELFMVAAICAGCIIGAEPATETVYARHTVQAGDTVWDIAERYADRQRKPFNEFVFEIQQENKLAGRYIQPGDTLVIPLAVVK